MSNGVNKVFVFGHLGASPELRNGTGVPVLRFSVATNEVWFDKGGERHEHAEWHRVVVFGNRAEGLARFLDKGMSVLVEGRLRTSSYEKDGQRRYSTEIHATDVCVGGARRERPVPMDAITTARAELALDAGAGSVLAANADAGEAEFVASAGATGSDVASDAPVESIRPKALIGSRRFVKRVEDISAAV